VNRAWLALGLAIVFPGVMAWIYFEAVSPKSGAESPNRAFQIIYAGTKVIQFSFPLLFFRLINRSAWRRATTVSLRERICGSPAGIWLGVGFGLLAAGIILWLYHCELKNSAVFTGTPERLRSKVTEFGIYSAPGFIGLAAFLAILHSFLEEYYWRWFVHAFLRNWLRFLPAALISGLAFTGHHVFVLDVYFPDRFWSAVIPFSLGIAVGGIVWAWIYERSGSLLGPWLSHFLVDAAIMAVGYDILFES